MNDTMPDVGFNSEDNTDQWPEFTSEERWVIMSYFRQNDDAVQLMLQSNLPEADFRKLIFVMGFNPDDGRDYRPLFLQEADMANFFNPEMIATLREAYDAEPPKTADEALADLHRRIEQQEQ